MQTMASNTAESQVMAMLIENNIAGLKVSLQDASVHELVDLIPELSSAQQLILFRNMDRESAYQCFENLELSLQEKLLDLLPNRQLQLIVNDMSPDKRTALLEELPNDYINRLLTLLTPKERLVALSLLGYPENSIGRLMTPDYIAIQPDWTVQQVLNYIRENGEDKETLNVLYIVDEKGILIDDIRVREILLNEPDARIDEISDGKFVALNVTDDEESTISEFKQHNRVALPVIDLAGRLLGIVTIDDVLQLAEEEDTEDIQKIGAVQALEDPYMDTPLTLMIRKRAVWLVVLFIGELLTASAMSYYENEISKALVLMLFVPLIVSSGGNSGSQASTLIIRALALGEVTIPDWFKIMKREIVSGLVLGLILGLMGFARIFIFQEIAHIYGEHWFAIAMTVAVAVVGVVTWGTVMGSMLPLILKKMGLDPATSSTPFVATLVDVTGLIIYFTIASLFLKGSLL